VGIVESGPRAAAYGPGFHGILTGGNAVLTRAILQKVGPFSPALGPRADRRLFSCEDEDLYLRLLDAGARGRYVPDLVVYHHVHPERLTKRYYRRWCFWRGVSKAILSRRRAEPVAHVGGVPRYLLGRGGRGFATLLRKTLALGPAKDRFAAELTMWDLAGFVYGRHFYTDRTGFEAEHATDVTLSARSAKAPLVSAG
jgi:GT2 family glycosyltransferase